jgi:hypothetical protein
MAVVFVMFLFVFDFVFVYLLFYLFFFIGCIVNLFIYSTHFEVNYLFVISIFLHEQKQYSLAQKLHSVASTFDFVIHTSIPLASCCDYLVSFIQDNLTQSPTSSFPYPPTPAPGDMTKEYKTVAKMVENIFELVSVFLPTNEALLSTHGMQVLFKTISALCPPTISPCEFYPLFEY